MSVIATITTSLDGYVTGPHDGPGCGLGVGGERLHHWVMGGPWTYETERSPGGMTDVDQQYYDDLVATLGAGVCGRGMYESAGAWGGTNPFDGQLFVLTHRTAGRGRSGQWVRVRRQPGGCDGAGGQRGGRARRRRQRRGRRMRQALAAGYVDELAISTAPVVLGTGKRLFDGFPRRRAADRCGVPGPSDAHAVPGRALTTRRALSADGSRSLNEGWRRAPGSGARSSPGTRRSWGRRQRPAPTRPPARRRRPRGP